MVSPAPIFGSPLVEAAQRRRLVMDTLRAGRARTSTSTRHGPATCPGCAPLLAGGRSRAALSCRATSTTPTARSTTSSCSPTPRSSHALCPADFVRLAQRRRQDAWADAEDSLWRQQRRAPGEAEPRDGAPDKAAQPDAASNRLGRMARGVGGVLPGGEARELRDGDREDRRAHDDGLEFIDLFMAPINSLAWSPRRAT